MPIYEYKCKICAGSVELFHKSLNIIEIPKCNNCGGENTLEKYISSPNFTLKGSGWYETDFKNSSKKIVVHGVSLKKRSF